MRIIALVTDGVSVRGESEMMTHATVLDDHAVACLAGGGGCVHA